jgi:Short C-terminal domain
MTGPAPGAGYQAPPSPTSGAEELRKLAELRDTGVLSEQEFQAQKARPLS